MIWLWLGGMQRERAMKTYDLKKLPESTRANGVDVEEVENKGRAALSVALDSTIRAGEPGVDFVDQPTFLLFPEIMTDGAIEVDMHVY